MSHLDDGHLDYIKNQYGVQLKAEIDGRAYGRAISDYFYAGFQHPRENINPNVSKSSRLDSHLIHLADVDGFNISQPETWPIVLINKMLSVDEPNNTNKISTEKIYSLIGWLLYATLSQVEGDDDDRKKKKLSSPSTSNKDIKKVKEIPMNWDIVLDEAIKDNRVDPLHTEDEAGISEKGDDLFQLNEDDDDDDNNNNDNS